MLTVPGVVGGVGVGVPLGDGVVAGVGVGAAAPQGVNGLMATRNWVPPRAVSALLLPLAPEPAVVNALPRNPTRVEPIAIGVCPAGSAALSLLKATLSVTVLAAWSKNP